MVEEEEEEKQEKEEGEREEEHPREVLSGAKICSPGGPVAAARICQRCFPDILGCLCGVTLARRELVGRAPL